MKLRILCCCLLLALNAHSQDTLKVYVRMVEVYAKVSDGNGRPVPNLQPDDFRVVEEGRPQEIKVFEPQSSALTIALLVDTTGSMMSDLPKVKNAIGRLLSSLRPEDRVGL